MGLSALFLLHVSGKKITDDSFESEQKLLGGGGVEGTKAMSYKARKGYIELKVTAELSDNSQRETFFTNSHQIHC